MIKSIKIEEDSSAILQEEELYEHFNFVVDKGQTPLRIDRFLTDRIQNATRNKVQQAIEAGAVRVNSIIVKSNYKIKPLDTIVIAMAQPPIDTELKPENIPLDIRYEDDDVLVLNKPAGMVVHPAYNNWTGTLVNALVYHFEQLPVLKNGPVRPGLVHRIDKDTSGLLVIAKTEHAMAHLARQFFDHSIERTYLALVWGHPNQEKGTINEKLARHPKDRRVTTVVAHDEEGKEAITHYELLNNYFYVSLLKCKLETGRTHQIRAHMKFIGHPLFNDAMYGGDKILKGTPFAKYRQFVDNCFEICQRQALHAHSLGFEHPKTGKWLQFTEPMPDDMRLVIDKWEKYANYQQGEGHDNQ